MKAKNTIGGRKKRNREEKGHRRNTETRKNFAQGKTGPIKAGGLEERRVGKKRQKAKRRANQAKELDEDAILEGGNA